MAGESAQTVSGMGWFCMRVCPVREITPGMVLGKSIYETSGRLLLGAGFRITSEVRMKLIEKGYSHVYIEEEGLEDVIPEDVISDALRHHAQARLADKAEEIRQIIRFQDLTFSKAQSLMEDGSLAKIAVTAEMRRVVREILKEISTTGVKYQNTILFKTKDTYFFDHSINTAILSILIGMRFRFSKAELAHLALGAFLHDIGKIIIEQLKPDTEDPEKNLYGEHPTYGYLLLRKSPEITPMEAQVVNQHHECQDGSGFPIGLKGENLPPIRDVQRKRGTIFRFAEICCVANAYDNLVMNPLGGERLAPEHALRPLVTDAGKRYNRTVVQALNEVIPIYPVGLPVQIEDIVDPALLGCYGVVARINSEHPNRPIIVITMNKLRKKVKPLMLDTSKLRSVKLKLII
jgi:HD-GYP domain-containing protein (c-di-GMP phosphodiesterase class II)